MVGIHASLVSALLALPIPPMARRNEDPMSDPNAPSERVLHIPSLEDLMVFEYGDFAGREVAVIESLRNQGLTVSVIFEPATGRLDIEPNVPTLTATSEYVVFVYPGRPTPT